MSQGMKPGSIWNDKAVSLLKDLIADPVRLFAKDIAARMSEMSGQTVSRNAIISKVSRMGLELPNKTSRGASKRTPRKKSFNFGSPKKNAVIPFPLPPPVNKGFVPPISQRVTFFDLKECHCRFIYGEPRDGLDQMFYCGGQTVFGTSWCKNHIGLVSEAPRYRQKYAEAAE